MTIRIFSSFLLFLSFSLFAAEPPRDVIVYGGTASGVIAAVAAAREGGNV